MWAPRGRSERTFAEREVEAVAVAARAVEARERSLLDSPNRLGASKMSKICSSGAGLASSAEAVASWRRGEVECVELLAAEDERREAARPSAVRARRMGVVGSMVASVLRRDGRRSSLLMYVWL